MEESSPAVSSPFFGSVSQGNSLFPDGRSAGVALEELARPRKLRRTGLLKPAKWKLTSKLLHS